MSRLEEDTAQRDKEKRADLIKSKLESLNEEELVRFEFFIRSHFSRQKVKDVMAGIIGKLPNDEQAIICGSLTKLFVGELVETATSLKRAASDNTGADDGAAEGDSKLSADDIRESVRQMTKCQKMSISGSVGSAPPLFERRTVPVFDDSEDAAII